MGSADRRAHSSRRAWETATDDGFGRSRSDRSAICLALHVSLTSRPKIPVWWPSLFRSWSAAPTRSEHFCRRAPQPNWTRARLRVRDARATVVVVHWARSRQRRRANCPRFVLASRGIAMKPAPFDYQAPGTLREAIENSNPIVEGMSAKQRNH